jgi:pimeloyl-ACP methyl ester carboxylesterase
MKTCMMVLLGAAMTVGCAAQRGGSSTKPANGEATPLGAPTVKLPAGKDTYVIVHGAWGGGWQFKTVDEMLSADGHKVYRPTLTGQGEHVNLANPSIDLNTQITDVVNVILWEDLHDVVLVGHSYGGMVITGVMDRVPERIKRVVFLDAFLPDDGQSLNTSRGNPTTQAGATTQPGRGGRAGRGFTPAADGMIYLNGGPINRPPPHDVGQPPLTLSQPVSFKNPAAKKLPVTYILTVDRGQQPPQDTFYPFYERAKARGYTTLTMEGDHNVQQSHPKELVELLEKK